MQLLFFAISWILIIFARVIYSIMGIFGFFNKEKKETLDKGLEKTKTSVFDKLTRAVAGKSKVDDDVLDNLEEVLITSDVGVDTTLKIIERIEERVARDKYVSTSELNRILRVMRLPISWLRIILKITITGIFLVIINLM